MYDGEIKFNNVIKPNEIILKFIKKIKDIMDVQHNKTDLQYIINNCVDIGINKDAEGLLNEFGKYIVASANKEYEESLRGIITRKYDLAIKYALIHHADNKNIFSPLTLKNIQYGILIAEALCDWKQFTLAGKITAGDFHKDCNIFKDSIIASLKGTTKNPTFKRLCNRKPAMKNWDDVYFDKIKKVLLKRREIIIKENGKGDETFLLIDTD